MKKLLISSMLVLTGMTGMLFAQSNYPVYYLDGKTKTERLFSTPYSGALRNKITIRLSKGNELLIEVPGRQYFEPIVNLDSLLNTVVTNLGPLKDSLKNEMTNKTVDYLIDPAGIIKIRYKEFAPQGNSYVVLNDGMAALKIEQDTLYIYGYQSSPDAKINNSGYIKSIPYRVRLLINDINNLKDLLDGSITRTTRQALAEWYAQKDWDPNINRGKSVYAFYNLNDPSKNISLRSLSLANKRNYYTPYVQVGIQGLNNSFVTSIGVGFEWLRISGRSEWHEQLFWEPYFGFVKDVNGKTKLRRNDFITFQHTEEFYEDNDRRKLEFAQIFSLGYLVHRSGTLFEENTFKFALPGIQYEKLFLHPEFVFHDFLKSFQPSLKLMLYLD